MRVAGLKIEETRVRVSIADKRLRMIKALKADEFALPGGEAENMVALKNYLLALKDDSDFRGVVIGLDFKNFSHHVIELPLKSPEDIRRALNFEMEKHLPLAPDEYIIDFITIGHTELGTRNLVFTLREEKIRWITRCLREEDVTLLGVRCSGIEALNALLTTEAPRDVMFVYGETGRKYVFAIKDSVPVIVRYARDKYELNALIYEHSGEFNKGVFVAGADGTSSDLEVSFTQLSLSIPNLIAISALKNQPVRLNFMPKYLKVDRFDIYPYAIAAMSALALILLFMTTIVSYYKDTHALGIVERKIEKIESTTSELLQTKKELEAIAEKREFLLEFQAGRNLQIEIFTHLSRILPESAWLSSLNTDERGNIEIQGYAKRSAELIGPLEKSSLFKNVAFSSSVTMRAGKERFSIHIELEPR